MSSIRDRENNTIIEEKVIGRSDILDAYDAVAIDSSRKKSRFGKNNNMVLKSITQTETIISPGINSPAQRDQHGTGKISLATADHSKLINNVHAMEINTSESGKGELQTTMNVGPHGVG